MVGAVFVATVVSTARRASGCGSMLVARDVSSMDLNFGGSNVCGVAR